MSRRKPVPHLHVSTQHRVLRPFRTTGSRNFTNMSSFGEMCLDFRTKWSDIQTRLKNFANGIYKLQVVTWLNAKSIEQLNNSATSKQQFVLVCDVIASPPTFRSYGIYCLVCSCTNCPWSRELQICECASQDETPHVS